ncbi:cupin domain-containing protein [Streptomyces sp. 6N223]|uniref:cupin domain-containing protein n=1 Tax=Streptomyces sp. 6N223 TaxID=3457412 RepID=UPI003FCF1563
MTGQTVVRHGGEGRAFWVLNGLYEIKVSSEESGGAMTIIEMTIPEGWGPPPHTHPGTETVYIVEGKVRYHIGDQVVQGGPGSLFHIPEGVWERFEPTSTARMLITYAPGGIEEFFAEIGEPAQRRELPPINEELDINQIIEAAGRHGLQMVQMPGT